MMTFRIATAEDFPVIKDVMSEALGRNLTDNDLKVRKYELEEDPNVEFGIYEEDGEPIGIISCHLGDVITIRAAYYRNGERDLGAATSFLPDYMRRKGKDAQLIWCPGGDSDKGLLALEDNPELTTSVKDLTKYGDWKEVTIKLKEG